MGRHGMGELILKTNLQDLEEGCRYREEEGQALA